MCINFKNKIKPKIIRGFTLIELLMVVAILGIISAIAVPTYVGYLSNTRAKNAQNNLRSIHMQQQEYFSDNNQYYATTSGSTCEDAATAINTNLFNGNENIKDEYYDYCILQTTSNDFVAHAKEKTSSGNDFTINQLGQVNF